MISIVLPPFKYLHSPLKSTNLTKKVNHLATYSYLEGFPETRLHVSVTHIAVQAQRERERTETWENVTGEDTDSYEMEREWMETIQKSKDASWSTAFRNCSAQCFLGCWGLSCKYKVYSQKLISFHTFVPCRLRGMWPAHEKRKFFRNCSFTF